MIRAWKPRRQLRWAAQRWASWLPERWEIRAVVAASRCKRSGPARTMSVGDAATALWREANRRKPVAYYGEADFAMETAKSYGFSESVVHDNPELLTRSFWDWYESEKQSREYAEFWGDDES